MTQNQQPKPQENHETHFCCSKRIKEQGGKVTCCECNPHEGCENQQPKVEEWKDKIICFSCIDDTDKNCKCSCHENVKLVEKLLAEKEGEAYARGYGSGIEDTENEETEIKTEFLKRLVGKYDPRDEVYVSELLSNAKGEGVVIKEE